MQVLGCACILFFFKDHLKTKKPPGALRQVVPFSHTDYCHDKKYILEADTRAQSQYIIPACGIGKIVGHSNFIV